MRALIMTSTFFAFAGAEMVALELAEELVARAWEVDVAAAVVGSPLSWLALSGRINLVPLPRSVDVSGYDLVWCQHGTLANIDARALVEASPFIATAHLSPTTAMEGPLHPLEAKLADLIVANSQETRDSLSAVLPVAKMIVSHNAAPEAFLDARRADRAGPGATIRSVLSITNHLPGELYHVLLHMAKDLGIAVTRIGFGAEFRRVTARDVSAADLVVTIGKSVPYALLAGTPVYVYDHLGGGGYLSEASFETACSHNFSGRPERRTQGVREIFDDITANHAEAAAFCASLPPRSLERFRLARFVDGLIERVQGERERKSLTADELLVCDLCRNGIGVSQDLLCGKLGSDGFFPTSVPSPGRYFLS